MWRRGMWSPLAGRPRLRSQSFWIIRLQRSRLVGGQFLPDLAGGLGFIRSTLGTSSHFFAHPFAHVSLISELQGWPQFGIAPQVSASPRPSPLPRAAGQIQVHAFIEQVALALAKGVISLISWGNSFELGLFPSETRTIFH